MTPASSSKEASEFMATLHKMDMVSRYQEAFKLTTGCSFRVVLEDQHHDNTYAAFPFIHEICVPVELGGRTVAHLCAEPLRTDDAAWDNFDNIARQMLEDGCSAAELRAARQLHHEAPQVSDARASALLTMLHLFAAQVGEEAGKVFLQTVDNEPDSVRRARKFIMENLTEPLTLEEVADAAGVSPFHFCKIFKRATGLTFTNYVNSARVEKAKRLLLKPQARVTEVAYDVGFQSLSQFNRSFRRIVSLSPTEYRCKLHKPVLAVASC